MERSESAAARIDEEAAIAFVACTLLQSLTLACTGHPLNTDAVAEAAKAHSHVQYARTLQGSARAAEQVAARCKAAAGKLAAEIGKRNLTRHIVSPAAAATRPIWDEKARTVAVGGMRVRTSAGPRIIALWDLCHAADHAAAAVVAALPATAPPGVIAPALSAAIAKDVPVAASRICAALHVALP